MLVGRMALSRIKRPLQAWVAKAGACAAALGPSAGARSVVCVARGWHGWVCPPLRPLRPLRCNPTPMWLLDVLCFQSLLQPSAAGFPLQRFPHLGPSLPNTPPSLSCGLLCWSLRVRGPRPSHLHPRLQKLPGQATPPTCIVPVPAASTGHTSTTTTTTTSIPSPLGNDWGRSERRARVGLACQHDHE